MKLASIFALSAMLTMSCGGKDEKEFNQFKISDLPQLAVGDSLQGVAAPFAGVVGSQLVVAGGCNFPDTPAAEGGQKRFYSEIFVLDAADPHMWEPMGELPKPLAYGATVAVPEGLVCIGGTSDGKTS
ncbi:MAG: cyclically-permuted mutarotase family protein, partial [Prevotella sp.]|nr:cyclically-permuted mutarotase family protein [Prevotella sp.]